MKKAVKIARKWALECDSKGLTELSKFWCDLADGLSAGTTIDERTTQDAIRRLDSIASLPSSYLYNMKFETSAKQVAVFQKIQHDCSTVAAALRDATN